MSGRPKVPRGPKTSLELPEGVIKRVKHLAIDRSTNLRAIVTAALLEYLAKHDPQNEPPKEKGGPPDEG